MKRTEINKLITVFLHLKKGEHLMYCPANNGTKLAVDSIKIIRPGYKMTRGSFMVEFVAWNQDAMDLKTIPAANFEIRFSETRTTTQSAI